MRYLEERKGEEGRGRERKGEEVRRKGESGRGKEKEGRKGSLLLIFPLHVTFRSHEKIC
jgi:hypothetical protein